MRWSTRQVCDQIGPDIAAKAVSRLGLDGPAYGILGICLAAALSTSACGMGESESGAPEAGDTVRPIRASAASPATPGRYSTILVYEYSNSHRWDTTGKRIRFRVDHALVEATNREDGPASSVKLIFDKNSLGPAAPGRPREIVSANLEHEALGGNLTPENISQADAGFGAIGRVPEGKLVPADAVCGLDSYSVQGLGSSEQDGFSPSAAILFQERWGSSMVFARRDLGGRYSDVIGCSKFSQTCEALTSYRDWPLRIWFGNSFVCDYAKIAADTRSLLDRFYVDETNRSPGQVERRLHPIPFFGDEK